MNEGVLRGSLIGEHKRCGKPNCRCARGELHGPYYYRRWRDGGGVQRKAYVPRMEAAGVQQALLQARADDPRVRLRDFRKALGKLRDEARQAQRGMGEELGRYWHGRQLRERRSFSAEQRDRALYRMNRGQIVAALGWEVTEDDFAALQQMIRSERKRRNRLGQPWRARDPGTGQEVVVLRLDLMQLPSYRKHSESGIGESRQ